MTDIQGIPQLVVAVVSHPHFRGLVLALPDGEHWRLPVYAHEKGKDLTLTARTKLLVHGVNGTFTQLDTIQDDTGVQTMVVGVRTEKDRAQMGACFIGVERLTQNPRYEQLHYKALWAAGVV